MVVTGAALPELAAGEAEVGVLAARLRRLLIRLQPGYRHRPLFVLGWSSGGAATKRSPAPATSVGGAPPSA